MGACASGTTTTPDLPSPSIASTEELNCRQITGRMQVSILEYRDFANQPKSSSLARGLQSAISSVFGGSNRGTDPEGEYAAALNKLRGDNQKLADKGCPTFDLEKELKTPAGGPPPRPSSL